MPQPVGPSAQTRWPDDPPDIPPPPLATNGRPPDPPEPAEMPDFDAEAYATASRAMGSAGEPQSPTFEAIGALHHAKDLEIQRQLNAFRAQATPTYHTPSGDVQVATPFRLPNYTVDRNSQNEFDGACTLLKLNSDERLRLRSGRGTPDQIHRVTQALIDRGALPRNGGSLEDRVRQLMSAHGIGLDCAGYVGHAFAASRGVDRAHTQLAQVPIEHDNLSNLRQRGFRQVGIEAARPGDLIVLAPPSAKEYPHTLIVYSARNADETDKQSLRISATRANTQDREALMQVAASGSLRVLVVDSSWGSDHDPLIGGVERRMWWSEPLTGKWVWTDSRGSLDIGNTPYGHAVEGTYRPRKEP